jgi:hypothetical protein
MVFAEQDQLATKVAGLLAPAGVTLGALSVSVDDEAVSANVTYNDTPQTIAVPAWRQSHTFTPYPANYIADRLLEYFGLPTTQ